MFFLRSINFFLANDIGRSFAMFSSVEIICELIDWEFLTVDAAISGSKYGSLSYFVS